MVFRQQKNYKNLRTRSDIIRAVRGFFFERDYLEVETPVRVSAPIPEAHIDLMESGSWCLNASPEICMKQLLAAGYEKIFQIARVFRDGERGAKHLPELTMLEWYAMGDDYCDLMEQLEEMIVNIAEKVNGGRSLFYRERTIDLTPPWDRITVYEAFERFSPVSMEKALEEERFDEIIGLEIEPNLGLDKPVFLYDYPVEKGSLARAKKDDKNIAERFELYISGLELCNGFSELVDPVEQKKRFIEEQKLRAGCGKKNYPLPERFLNSLEYIPPSAGVAVGIDRLVMLFTNSVIIDDVVAFTPEEV